MKYDIDAFYDIIGKLNLPPPKDEEDDDEITDEELELMIEDFIAEFSPYSNDY